MKKLLSFLFCLLAISGTAQQDQKNRSTRVELPAIAAIRPSELLKDLEELSSDQFRGREAGTIDELSASVWLAEKARQDGLKPAGDNGTFFQFFSMIRHRLSPVSTVQVGAKNLALWRDVLVAQTAPGRVDAEIYFAGEVEPDRIDSTKIRNKAVVIAPSPKDIDLNISLPERRYPGFILRKYAANLLDNGAAAIIFIADEMGEKSWEAVLPAYTRGLYDIEGGNNYQLVPKVPVLWMHASAMNDLRSPNARLKAELVIERFEYPSVNVAAMIEGTSTQLKNEYVMISGHQDHDGLRTPYGEDSIYNGADDNGTMTVAMLAIARAFKAKPAQRSILFVWHGAEERGLLGSRWYSSHPTIEKKNIIAVLNGDMIGRNHPDSAALLGSTAPHRNSVDLVNFALQANNEGPKFIIDSTWDSPSHPEFWYFRSDHLPYARAGIPALFFSSLLHSDYHTPMDEAGRIDLKKLTRMTQWIYRTALIIAAANKKPRLEPGFKLER